MSDVLRQNPPWLSKPATFEQAFPSVAQLVVRCEQTDMSGATIGRDHYVNGPGEALDCRNPRCYGGGIRIGEQVRFMVDAGKTAEHHDFSCGGYEGSPKGRRRTRPCDTRFKVDIEITYK